MITPEWEDKLTIIAETCVSHMKGIQAKQEAGEEVHAEDYGILALERAFLVLYGIHIKGEIPEFANEYLSNEVEH